MDMEAAGSAHLSVNVSFEDDWLGSFRVTMHPFLAVDDLLFSKFNSKLFEQKQGRKLELVTVCQTAVNSILTLHLVKRNGVFVCIVFDHF